MNRIYLLLLSSFLLFSCTTQSPKTETKSQLKTSKNDLISSEVIAKDYINVVSNDNPDWVKSAVDSKIIQLILDGAISGKTVYAPDDTTIMTADEINSTLGMSKDTQSIEISEGVIFDTVIVTPPNLKQVEALFFKENWFFDAKNFKFTKKINEYLPVRVYNRMVENVGLDTTRKAKSLVFKVVNKDSVNFEKIADNVTTAFYFYAEEPSYINGLDVSKFANYLINYAYKDNKSVYDFYEQSKTLSDVQINAGLGASSDTIEIEVSPGNVKETVLNYEPDASEIIGVIFVENWYLDKETLSFKKEITGLAPIRRYNDVDPEGANYVKTTIPYLIKL